MEMKWRISLPQAAIRVGGADGDLEGSICAQVSIDPSDNGESLWQWALPAEVAGGLVCDIIQWFRKPGIAFEFLFVAFVPSYQLFCLARLAFLFSSPCPFRCVHPFVSTLPSYLLFLSFRFNSHLFSPLPSPNI